MIFNIAVGYVFETEVRGLHFQYFVLLIFSNIPIASSQEIHPNKLPHNNFFSFQGFEMVLRVSNPSFELGMVQTLICFIFTTNLQLQLKPDALSTTRTDQSKFEDI